eukprot:284877-Pyramimonas_sp.AAC.1
MSPRIGSLSGPHHAEAAAHQVVGIGTRPQVPHRLVSSSGQSISSVAKCRGPEQRGATTCWLTGRTS